MKTIDLHDKVVIYQSKEDGGWIAHSLRTDQIGYGDSIVDALADVMKAVDQVCRAAEQDPTLAYLRDAPKLMKRLFKNAKPLPKEIYEVAHRKVHGQWPKDWTVLPQEGADAFKTQIREPGSIDGTADHQMGCCRKVLLAPRLRHLLRRR